MINLDCNARNPLFHSGTSQKERLLAALKPSFVQIDERKPQDLILFAANIATKLNYYNSSNDVNGHWEEFIRNDVSSLLSIIALTDTRKIKDEFAEIRTRFYDNIDSADPLDETIYHEFFPLIVSMAKTIDGWMNASLKDLQILETINGLISNVLKSDLDKLISYDKGAASFPIPSYVFDSSVYDGLSSVWEVNVPAISPDTTIYIGSDNKDRLNNAFVKVNFVFNAFLRAQTIIVNEAPGLLERTLRQWPDHEPHMGLFLTFIQLFSHAQNDINQLTKKHLDYYYIQVLQLLGKDAVPDKVHVIFELAKDINTTLIAAGTSLSAGTDSLGNDVFFKTTQDIVVNKAKVDSIRSVFVEKKTIDVTNSLTIEDKIIDVYASPLANSTNGVGPKPVADGQFWPAFGESQFGKTDEERTMPSATIGFAVSSPVLFLKEGERSIIVTIQIPETQRWKISEGIRLDDLQADIKNSVKVFLSGEKGWIEKSLHEAIISTDDSATDNALAYAGFKRGSELSFIIYLTKDDKAVVAYDKQLLLDPYTTQWPLVKFVLDDKNRSSIPLDNLLVYDAHTDYLEGAIITFKGVIYKAVEAVLQSSSPEVPSTPGLSAKWQAYESVNDFLTDKGIKEFNKAGKYLKGEVVNFNNNLYTAITILDGTATGTQDVAEPGSDDAKGQWRLLTPSYAYQFLKDIQINQVVIDVEVNDVSSLVLNSETSNLDPNKPFAAFGSNPTIDSVFYIGNQEIFQKKLSSLDLNISWEGLPDKSFNKYYSAYANPTPTSMGGTEFVTYINNRSFRTRIDMLDNGEWKNIARNAFLFDSMTDDETISFNGIGASPSISPYVPYSVRKKANELIQNLGSDDPVNNPPRRTTLISIDADTPVEGTSSLVTIDRNVNTPEFTTFTQSLNRGFIRLVLKRTIDTPESVDGDGSPLPATTKNTSPIRAFGHQEYNGLFTDRIIKKSANPDDPKAILPEAPYTPTIKKLTLNYTSRVSFSLSTPKKEDFDKRIEYFYHIQPFGVNEVHKQLISSLNPLTQANVEEGVFLLTQFSSEGYLYLGIINLTPPQNLSLLFQLQNGTNDPELSLPDVAWSYLSNNEWKSFPRDGISFDSTEGLVKSGLIVFNVPEDATSGNTILPSGKHWIRAKVDADTRGLNKNVAIVAQAVLAEFVNEGNDPNRVATGLPAGTIKELRFKDNTISKLSQPFVSGDGKLKEEGDIFYTRVSERLRHKERAITIWDYERLVLEYYPSVYRAKCLNHTTTRIGIFKDENGEETVSAAGVLLTPEEKFKLKLKKLLKTELVEGEVTVVLVPKLIDLNSPDIFEPKVGVDTLKSIKDFLKKKVTPFINIYTENPLYEKVQVKFDVVFLPGFDKSYYTGVLNTAIKRFLTPWAFDLGRDIVFGGKLHKSVVLDFVESQSYVDVVTHFDLYHSIELDGDLYTVNNGNSVEEAVALTSRSVLSSADTHLINAVDLIDIDCGGGIGFMVVETTFVSQ